MNNDFQELKQQIERLSTLQAAMTLFSWDNETLAPEEATEYTTRIIGQLSSQYFSILTGKEVGRLLKRLKKAEDLTESQRAILRSLSKERKEVKNIPPKEYQEKKELEAKSYSAWNKAKNENDYESFAPCLEKIITFSKKFAGYKAKKGQSLYDAALDSYEASFDQEVLDRFFKKLKKEIVPLLKKVEKAPPIDDSFLKRSYDVEKQKEFNRYLAEYLGFDFKRGVIAESEHPFTTNLHNHDVRITTHYYKRDLTSALFSTIHECGHALYEMNVDDSLTLTPVGTGASCGMHESQSRFMENMIGRSRAFWVPLYGRLQELFPKQLGHISLDQFVEAINKAQPGLIRIDADELTYSLHIMIRYELEKEIFSGEISVEELPKRWKEKYKAYLGISPENDKEGVLQDVHWAEGMFGYFPSYALGNAFAAQIYHAMGQELDIDVLLEEGQIGEITGWLKEKIHRYGAVKKTRKLLKEVTGEEFNPDYYIRYLKEKYTRLYHLN